MVGSDSANPSCCAPLSASSKLWPRSSGWNYWFNTRNGLSKNDVKLHQFGIRQGGPIVIPGLYDGRGKAFFFVHDEELRLPNDVSRVRTTYHPRALDGWFRYTVTAGGQEVVREINVLDVARNGGQLASTDPIVMRLLNNINSSTQTTGLVAATTDPNENSYSWLTPAKQVEHQPAVRIDYNITDRHRLTGTFNKLWQDRNPDQLNDFDQRFPGAPNFGHTVARRPQRSFTLRSTLSSASVNEVRVGISRGERIFFGQRDSGGGPQTFEEQGGYAVDLGDVTNWHTRSALSGRSAYQYTFADTVTWQRGRHSVTVGGEAFLGRAWDDSQTVVPGINLGFSTANDPAAGLFSTANFPGASTGQLGDARLLYAVLTGRVASVTGQATLNAETNKYEFLGNRRRHGKLDNYSTFVQDSWRVTPTLTLNAGVRWDVQTPFSPLNDTMSVASLADVCGVSGLGDGGLYSSCNFFKPGASGGKVPEFEKFASGNGGYNTDWNNVAPNVGVAWRPHVQSGWLRTLLGDPEQATIRGGYSVAYERQGFGEFTGIFGPNSGSTLSLTRDANTGLVPAGESWPVLLRQTNRLYPAPFPESPSYPIALRANRADNINAFHPTIKIASARSWTIGFQRAISTNMAVEARYVGTRGVDQWSDLNYNERNIENGFFDEFKLAMANLQVNNAAGGTRAGSFAYFGPGTGTAPLPTYLAYLVGRTDAGNAAAYSGGNWTNTALTADMVRTNPQPFNSAADLDGDNIPPEPRDYRRCAGQLLRRQPARRNCHGDRQRRVQRLPCAPDRAAAAAVARIPDQYQLPVRDRGNLGVPGLPVWPRHESERQRPARDQEPVELDRPGRPRTPLRHQHAPDSQRHRRRLGAERCRAHPGAHGEFRQRPPGRHDARRRPGDVQVRHPHQPRQRAADSVHAAGRRHPQHAAGLQHQPDVGDRLLGSRRPRGALLRAGQQRQLHPAEVR